MPAAASRRLFLLAAAAILATPAAAQSRNAVDAAQSAIAGQIEAFLADDGAAAYGFAAPNIRRMFPSVESFMAMVESGYQPVRRPSSHAFGKTMELGSGILLQEVLLTGPDGKGWKALYRMQLQPDGTWKISGVSLKSADLPAA